MKKHTGCCHAKTMGVRVEGEESGEDFLLDYSEISPDTHLIYKLTLMNPQEW